MQDNTLDSAHSQILLRWEGHVAHTHTTRVKCLQIFGREHTTIVCMKFPYETGYF